jgi:mono/diheme cytochrome c family protein
MRAPAFSTFWKARARLAGGVIAFGFGVIIAGCASQGTVAPPVTTAMLGARGGTLETLTEGRRIFVGPCARCHAPDPLSRYGLTEWQASVDKMAPRAKLDASAKASLLAYIAAAKSAPAVTVQR